MAKQRKEDIEDTKGSDMPFGGRGKMGRKKSRKGKRSKGRY